MEDATTSTMAPAASPTSALSPEDAEAAEEILAAFDSYMEGLIELSTEGVPGGTEETLQRLEEVHVGDEAFLQLTHGLLTPNAMDGLATAGTITWTADVMDIDWENTYDESSGEVFPEATLRACIDETEWTTVDVETGDVVDGPGTRYISTVVVAWRAEDPERPDREPRWEVVARADQTEPC